MKQVVTLEEAVGFPLAHDITEIRPGEFKGAAFRKGHILKLVDLEHLRKLGKNHLYVLKTEENELHEDEAAEALANALCGDGVGWQEAPKEGKITLKATRDGLFKVDVDALMQFNMQGDVMCATRHTNTMVKKGDTIAATRAIPLVVAKDKVKAAIDAARLSSTNVLRVIPIDQPNVSVLITGNEVFYGLIKDKFESIITKKVEELGGNILEVVFLPDDDDMIAEAARCQLDKGCNLLITTGGMSVDPDDRTRHAMEKGRDRGYCLWYTGAAGGDVHGCLYRKSTCTRDPGLWNVCFPHNTGPCLPQGFGRGENYPERNRCVGSWRALS